MGGRGGAGNFRSLSRNPEQRARDDEEQRKIQEEEVRTFVQLQYCWARLIALGAYPLVANRSSQAYGGGVASHAFSWPWWSVR